MARPLAGKTFIVTGAASSVGTATALHLATLGAHLALVDVAGVTSVAGKLESLVKSGKVPQFKHVGSSVNATDRERVQQLVRQFLRTFGCIDGLVHCIDVGLPANDFHDETVDAIQTTIQVNIGGAVNFAQAFAAIVLARKADPPEGGYSIILLGPPSKIEGSSALGYMSRSATAGLVKALADEYKTVPVRCNAVGLGKENTSFFSPEENPPQFAQLVGFLLSPAAAYITGACIPVDLTSVSHNG